MPDTQELIKALEEARRQIDKYAEFFCDEDFDPTMAQINSVLSRARSADEQGGDTEDMANVGEALMEAIRDYSSHPFMQHWHPADCPSEIVGDLLCALDEARQPTPPDDLVEVVAWSDVIAERRRQVQDEGWTPEHDDEHDAGELAGAGAAYALNAGCLLYPHHGTPLDEPPEFWMWDKAWWKPQTDPDLARRDLVKAAALIVAEIERIDRAAAISRGDHISGEER